MSDGEYKGRDGNMILNPAAYCKTHRCYMTVKQIKVHKCLQKQCTGLKRLEHHFWKERQRKKNAAKEKKKGYKA